MMICCKSKTVCVLFVLCASLMELALIGDIAAQQPDSDGESGGDASDEQKNGETLAEEQQQSILYSTPNIDNYYIYEHFDDEQAFAQRWFKSETSKSEANSEFKYDGEWAITQTLQSIKGDSCLIVKSRARHHAISAKLDKPFKFDGKPLILQYEAQFRNGQECGGAYIKLLSSPSGNLKQLNDKSQYSIMFGPDKCGNDVKLHFIFQHKNPRNGTLAEKHWKKAANVNKLDEAFKDNRWHQFRLEINPDNTYEITFDKINVGKGSLLEDFNPAVNPPKEIDDPKDSKPDNWDEREKIADPDAVKPEEWDENAPRKIADPSAVKPSDWDENEGEMIPDSEAKQPSDWDLDMDGEWEAPLVANPKCAQLSGCGKWSPPLIDNPKYKGKWRPPMIDNPAFKGKWSPRKIRNPEFFEDLQPYRTLLPIDAVAFELWTISDGIAFDNVLMTDDIDVAKHISSLTYQIKKEMSDSETDNWFVRALKYTNKYPWLWAVYLLAIGLPVVLFIAFCCVSPSKKQSVPETKESAASGDNVGATVAQRKKSDLSTPDDLVEEEEAEEYQEEEEANDDEPEAEEEGEGGELSASASEKEAEEPQPEVRSSPRLRKTRARKE